MESPVAPHRATPAELQARLEAERSGSPFLIWRDDGGAQRILLLTVDRVSVGRRAEADVPLPWDDEVSRLHALFESVGGEWTVVDDGLSRNGTWVGADRLSGRRRLADGDVVRCGKTLIAFSDPIGANTRATAQGGEVAIAARISEAQRRVLIALCRPYAEGPEFATPATNQQIADELFLSVDAVKSHLRALFDRFGIGDVAQNAKRAELVHRALRTGVVTERDLRSQSK